MEKNKTKKIAFKLIPLFALMLFIAGTLNVYAWGGFGNQNNLTDVQKQTLEQARDLKQQGKFDEAQNLIKNSGIQLPERAIKNQESTKERHQNNLGIRTAIENNNYTEFKKLIADKPFTDQVNEQVFAKIVQAHNLRMGGDFEGAKTVMNEIGFKVNGWQGKGFNRN